MKNIVTSCISILLAIAIALSATSCGVKYVADSITEASETVKLENQYSLSNSNEGESDELSPTEKEMTIQLPQNTNYENISFYAPSEDDFEYDEYVEYSDEYSDTISVEDMEELQLCIEEYHKQNVFSLANDCIAYDLHAAGYAVFMALAQVGNNSVPGLAFTKYEEYAKTNDQTVYSCGFVQITEEGVDSEVAISPEDVEAGVVVIPYGEYDTSTGFIVSMGVSIPSYSGIYDSYYFRYDQVGDYSVSISVKEDSRELWDESIDLYNFDAERFVFKGDLTYSGTSASPFLSDEAKAYATAREAVEKIIDIQNSNAYKVEKQVIIIFTEDALEEVMLNSQKGTINGFLIDEINKITVESNQFLVVTSEGVTVETVVDTDAIAKERLTNGIIGFIGSALLVAGSIVITVATCGAGTPIAISAICIVAGGCATAYGVSNLIESAQDIYYGATGDIYSQSFNPVLECFKKAIPDDDVATKAYHAWGIGSSLIQSLIVPANAAISLSKTAGASVWGTTIAVGRAVSVELVKMTVTGVIAGSIGYGTNVLVTELTGSENWGKIAGFGSTLLSGMFTYKGVNKLDAKYNFSGLHSKVQIPKPHEKEPLKQFDSDENLQHHFEEHKDQFHGMFENKEQYLDAANYVLKNGEYIPELNGYVKFIGVEGKANYAFVGLKNSGQNISTFHIKSVTELSKNTSFLNYLSLFGR